MQKNAVKSFRSRLLNKFESVKEETNSFSNYLTSCLEEYEKKISEVCKADSKSFFPLYKKLNQDLENFHDKIIVLQAEICSDENSGDESVDNFEDSLLELDTKGQTDFSLCHNLTKTRNSSEILSTKRKLESLDLQKNIDVKPIEKECDFSHDKTQTLNEGDSHLSQKQHEWNSYLSQKQHEWSQKNASFDRNINKTRNSSEALSVKRKELESLDLVKSFDLEQKSDFSNCKTEAFNLYKDNSNLPQKQYDWVKSENETLYLSANNCLPGNKPNFSKNELHLSNPSTSNEYVDSENLQSSCYHSLSSVSSDVVQVPSSSFENNSIEKKLKDFSFVRNVTETKSSPSDVNFSAIRISELALSSKHFVTLTNIVDPSDFWLQIENGTTCVKFPICEYVSQSPPFKVTKGFFYLALLKNSSFYHRIQALNSASKGEDVVEAFFIDQGSKHEVCAKDIRQLPWHMYDVPTQAYHCFLFDILPVERNWSSKAINRFKEFQNYCIEAEIRAIKDSTYGVQLIARASADLSEDFSSDIGIVLEAEGLALALESEEAATLDEDSYSFVEKVCSDKSDFNNFSLLPDETFSHTNGISHDSGVSVSSNHKSINFSEENFSFNSATHANLDRNSPESFVPDKRSFSLKKSDLKDFSRVQHNLISFERFDENPPSVSEKQMTVTKEQCKQFCDILDKKQLAEKKHLMNLTVPDPTLSFVKKNNMLVMISSIVSPQDFHVNLAMENCEMVDELREQMASFYDLSLVYQDLPTLCFAISEAFENMFCACRYKDGFWYRAKVLHLNKQWNKITIQFIDYGDIAEVDCSDLRLLSSQFANMPAFAIHCSLAGIVPKKTKAAENNLLISNGWDAAAIDEFKKLATFEKPLTAEICEDNCDAHSDPLHVLLWDTTSSEDVLINFVLIRKGVAESAEKNNYLLKKDCQQNINDVEVLNNWDPMTEEYNGIDNSYGVDLDDIQVAAGGYNSKDDEYTCKYFSLRGTCPRQDCPFLHEAKIESDITRDQEEVYSFDIAPLVSEGECDILLEVLVVKSPFHFYAILPFGNKTVDEIDTFILQGGSYNDLLDAEVKSLQTAMNEHYTTAPFDENTNIALAFGSIIAAKSKLDNQWHRGRIIDVVDMCGPAKVFFVDFGNEEWVDRKLIRKILPQFLHTPFQALQCLMADIEPINFEKGVFWSEKAIDLFSSLITGSLLLAHIHQRCGNVLYVTLKKTLENDHSSISEALVAEGYAKYVSKDATQKNETLYVPG